MELSACIVVYNGAEEALRAAQTVLDRTRRHPLTLYLVDNASPDGSGQRLTRAAADGTLRTAPGQQVQVLCRTKKRRLRHRAQYGAFAAAQPGAFYPEPGHPAHRRHPERPGRLDGAAPRCGDGPPGPDLSGRAAPAVAAAPVQCAGHGLPPAALPEVLGKSTTNATSWRTGT